MITITRKLEFDAGHRIPDHKSQCRNLHGHRYTLELTLVGNVIEQEGNSDNGMIMDFGDIKTLANAHLVDKWDHAFIVYEKDSAVRAFLDSYQSVRALEYAERQLLNPLLRAGALRFWISRLWDYHLPREANLLKAHDPTHFERVLRQRVQGRADGLGVGLNQMGCGLAMGLGLDVGGKLRRAVVNAQCPLRLRARRGDEARRQRSRSRRKGIALEHHRLDARALQGQCSRQAAGPGAHNGHRDLGVGLKSRRRQHLDRQ